jgi:DNA-binding beta-propeller fold protein YncE
MKRPIAVGLTAAALIAILGGCSAPTKSEPAAATFYPAPPQAPRLQFLTAYSGEHDLGGGPSKFATFVVGKEPMRKPILKPYGVALHGGKMYVCDVGASAIDVLDLRARELRYHTPSGEGKLVSPVNIALDRDGTRYVADSASGQVLIFGADDSFRGALGKRTAGAARAHSRIAAVASSAATDGAEEAMKPTDVQVAGDRIYVADLKNQCVRVYDKARRTLLFTIPRDPGKADLQSKLFAPVNLAVDVQGRLYVSDLGAFRVQQYAPDGSFLRTFGKGVGDKPGEFARPKGVAVDREGRVYVVDAATQVVQIFDPEGRLLLFFGEMQGATPGLDLPAKVTIDYDHTELFAAHAAPGFQIEYLVIVTSQYGDRKVSVFGFGHRR